MGLALFLLLLFLYASPDVRAVGALPAALDLANAGEMQRLQQALTPGSRAMTASGTGDERLADVSGATVVTYRLFGVLPVKNVLVEQSAEKHLTPGGRAVGITIETQGLLVVGLGSVQTAGGPQSPGAAAGLAVGDVLLSANGNELVSASSLTELCAAGEEPLVLSVARGKETRSVEVVPVRSAEGVMQLGLWVRDSTAGVGTLSFFDSDTHWYAALGHPVSDVDTRTVLRVREGKLLPSRIADVRRGAAGEPGELVGVFLTEGDALGDIRVNGNYGIYGVMPAACENALTGNVPLARAGEVHTGAATLLTTVSDAGVEAFSCEITRVSAQSAPAAKGMVLEITDERLLAATGGIVQGMSGSPVLQDGKLVGVVTHVFVNDPTRGYCVFAEWMHGAVMDAAS